MKSETTFVNQLLILVQKCGLRFFVRASEHYAKNDLKSYYSTVLFTLFLTGGKILAGRSFHWEKKLSSSVEYLALVPEALHFAEEFDAASLV